MNVFSLLPQNLTPGAAAWATVVLLLVTLVKGWPKIKEIQVGSDSSLRHDLFARVTQLEDDLRDERRNCDDQLRLLRDEIRGLHRQLIAFQLASGRPMPLDTPETDKAVERLIDRLTEEE